MQIRRIRNVDELSTLTSDWNRLCAGVPFRSVEWLMTWWRHYEPAMSMDHRKVELYVLCVSEGNELIGLAPWYIERSLSGGQIVRFLGSGEVCSDYLNILCQEIRQTAVAEALADWLTRSCKSTGSQSDGWDIIELTGVDACETMPRQLADQLHQRGAEIQSFETENTWRIELPATLDEFLGELSKSHRKQLRQFQRRFFDTNRAVLRTVDHVDRFETGWRILTDLHQRRLQSLGKPGCFQSNTFEQFHRAVTELFFRQGRLGLHWLEFDGRPVAAEYQILGDDVVFAYLGGIEPDALECEPGRLITFATLQRAIEDEYRGFDFCRGDEPYKSHWRATPRANVSWRVVSTRSSARLRNRLWTAGQSARKWIKRVLDPHRLPAPDRSDTTAEFPARSKQALNADERATVADECNVILPCK